MAYVAVNKDGGEVIGETLIRVDSFWEYPVEALVHIDPYDYSAGTEWGYVDGSTILPKGTIKKLIGRELTWDDEPVWLNGEYLRY